MSTKQIHEVETNLKSLAEEELKEDITISDEDDVLSKKIDLRIEEGKYLHNERSEQGNEAMHLFRGEIDKVVGAKANKYKDKSVLSRIFLTIRNLVGLATDSPAFVEIIPDSDSPKAIKRAKAIESNIEWRQLNIGFNEKLTMGLYDAWIKGDVFLHWFWNFEEDDVDLEVVSIDDITFAPDATTTEDAEYIIYHPWKNRKWWKKFYPKHYDDIKFSRQGIEKGYTGTVTDRGNVAQFKAYWEDDILIEKVAGKEGKDIILRKDKNPYYEWREPEDQYNEMFAKMYPDSEQQLAQAGLTDVTDPEALGDMFPEMQAFVPIKNYLNNARKPFVQLPSIKLLGELYSEAITVKQVKEVFLSMNEKKRAFADNLRGCNQKIVVDSDSFTKEEAEAITDEPNQVLRSSFSETGNPVQIIKGGEVPNSFHKDIQHDEQYIDDAYGHHAISRGAGDSGTLGQDQMNAESDRTPIRLQTRATERAIIEYTEGWLQLMRLFYTKTHYAKKFGEKDGIEVIELINEDITEGVKPHMKPGSMITISKVAKAQRAVEMFIKGALDPYTMYADMDMPNPQEMATRLVNWINGGIISTDDPDEIAADQIAVNPGLQSVERADQENKSIQAGDNIPPTPEEYLTEEHVKAHFAFHGDPNVKLDDEDNDRLLAHAETDKAALKKTLMAQGQAQSQAGQQQQGGAPQQVQA